jgi:hypothetical protein
MLRERPSSLHLVLWLNTDIASTTLWRDSALFRLCRDSTPKPLAKNVLDVVDNGEDFIFQNAGEGEDTAGAKSKDCSNVSIDSCQWRETPTSVYKWEKSGIEMVVHKVNILK